MDLLLFSEKQCRPLLHGEIKFSWGKGNLLMDPRTSFLWASFYIGIEVHRSITTIPVCFLLFPRYVSSFWKTWFCGFLENYLVSKNVEGRIGIVPVLLYEGSELNRIAKALRNIFIIYFIKNSLLCNSGIKFIT